MLRRLLPSPSMVVALVALFVALGGSAYAALVITGRNIRNSTVQGSDIKNGALHTRDVKVNSLTGTAIRESSLTGVQTAEGLGRWAVVNANGTGARGRGTTSPPVRTSEGRYQVIFDRDVRSCAFVATIGDPGAAAPPQGEIATSALDTNVNGVSVRTENSAGAAADRPFHLVVNC